MESIKLNFTHAFQAKSHFSWNCWCTLLSWCRSAHRLYIYIPAAKNPIKPVSGIIRVSGLRMHQGWECTCPFFCLTCFITKPKLNGRAVFSLGRSLWETLWQMAAPVRLHCAPAPGLPAATTSASGRAKCATSPRTVSMERTKPAAVRCTFKWVQRTNCVLVSSLDMSFSRCLWLWWRVLRLVRADPWWRVRLGAGDFCWGTTALLWTPTTLGPHHQQQRR